jgi:hypothetical protein
MRPTDIQAIAYGLGHNSTLLTLKLDDVIDFRRKSTNGARQAAFMLIFWALKKNTSLRHLVMCENNLVDEDAKPIASALRHTSSLQYLDLSQHKFTYQGIQQLCDAVAQCTSLVSLDLGLLHDDPSATSVA